MTAALRVALAVLLCLAVARASGRASSLRRIVGGSPAPSGKFPWFVQLSKIGGHAIGCGMSMVSPTWGMTACHCVIKGDYSGYYPGPGSEITSGCTKLGSSSCRSHRIKRWVPHPCYTISCCDDHDDLCLAEMEAPVELPSYASVAGLHGTLALPPGSPVVLIGMGNTDSSIHGTLMQLEVNTASQSACQAAEPKAHSENLINFNNVLCTGGQEGQDSCNGDSGSPVVGCFGNKSWVLGVLVKGTEMPRTGPMCGAAGRMGVYTRLDKYTQFISSTINGQPYQCPNCHKQNGDSCTAATHQQPGVPATPGCGEFKQLESPDWGADRPRLIGLGLLGLVVLLILVSTGVHLWNTRCRGRVRPEGSVTTQQLPAYRIVANPVDTQLASADQGRRVAPEGELAPREEHQEGHKGQGLELKPLREPGSAEVMVGEHSAVG